MQPQDFCGMGQLAVNPGGQFLDLLDGFDASQNDGRTRTGNGLVPEIQLGLVSSALGQ